MPKKTRKFKTRNKTTTKEGKREYMRQYMANLRKGRRQVFIGRDETVVKMNNLKRLRNEFPSVFNMVFGKPKRKRRTKK